MKIIYLLILLFYLSAGIAFLPGENFVLLYVYGSGFFIFYFTVPYSLISRFYFLDDYLVYIDHINTDAVQLFNLVIYEAKLCIVASRYAGKASCGALNRITPVQNSVSYVCESICYVNCSYCHRQTRSCSVNCRTFFLNYRMCRLKKGIYHAWKSFCYLLNLIYQVCYGNWFVNYRCYALKNPTIDYDLDPSCGSGIMMLESFRKLTKKIIIFNSLNFQNTIYRLETDINDRHLLVKIYLF